MKTNDIAGDGTTTATVLTHAILKEAAKYQAAGINRWELKRGIDSNPSRDQARESCKAMQ